MKNTRKRRSNASREFQLPANVMQEEAWEDDGPNMKLSKAFIVVLGLHIVAVAGLAAFNFFEGRTSKSTAENPALPERKAAATPTTGGATTVDSGKSAVPPGPVELEGMKPVKVTSQRTTAVLAAEYGLSEAELLHLNRHTPLIKGVVLPGEVVYVPDTAMKVVTLDDLKVAPAVAAPRTEPEPEPARTQELVEDTIPETKPAPEKPRVQDRPQRTSPVVQPRPPRATSRQTPKVVKAKPKTSSGSRTHTIGKGENLFRISLKYGVSVSAIQNANGITDPGRIKAGQVLKIPR